MATRFYDFGAFRIDKLNHVLMRNGETLSLKPKVFDTLLVLVENRERVIDKDELLSRLWPDTVVEESNLSQNIYLLRKALGEEPHGESFIQTMPKRGYRFVAQVREVEADPPSDRATANENTFRAKNVGPSGEMTLGHQRGRESISSARSPSLLPWKSILILGGAAATIVFTLWLGLVLNKSRNAGASPQINSIAVLPFKPLASEIRDEGLEFGLADTLITRLSNIKTLKVRSTSSVRRFNSIDQDPIAAGRELKVDAVVDATIQRTANQIRINLRLVRVSDGVALWNGHVDQPISETFVVQDRVAEQVARALVPSLTGEEQKLLVKRYTENTEAYRLYALGRYHLSRTTVEDWKKAIEYFNAAIAKDQDYALAYTGLANAYLSLIADSLLPKEEAILNAKQAATRALLVDEALPEAHIAAGRIKTYYDWDWAGAQQEFERAIELDSNSCDAHREYAAYLTNIGRSEQALPEAKRATDLDPLNQVTNFQLAWTLIAARRYDEAIQHGQQSLNTFPAAHFWIGMAYLGKKMYAPASAEFEKRLSLSKDYDVLARSSLAFAEGMSGRKDEARKILAEFQELYDRRQMSPYYIAVVYAGLGDKDQAFTWLDKCYRQRSRPLASGLKVNPVWENLRADSRFADLLRRMGLSRVDSR